MNETELIDEICKLESERSAPQVHIRTKVLTEGKKLRALQKWQKGEQQKAKEAGETPQTWKDYVAEKKVYRVDFPSFPSCSQYMRISQYPAAYEAGMSIKEAYKMATAYKKNGGNPPITAKVSIQNRLPARIGAACGQLIRKLEKWNLVEDWAENSESEKWTEDDFLGLEGALLEARQELNCSIRKFNAVKDQYEVH